MLNKDMVKTKSILFLILAAIAVSVQSKPLDSLRIEIVNGKRFIIHKVEKGQGLYAIARRYNIDVQKIIEANATKSEKINIGDLLSIPLLPIDSFISTFDLKPIHSNLIKQTKTFKDSALKKTENITIDESHANADTKENDRTKTHIVSQGETINKIAQKYKITPQLISKWNGLKSNKLEPGQILIIDGSMVIKPFEKWNTPNSISSKFLNSSLQITNDNFVEETGFVISQNDSFNMHRNAPIGSLLLVTNLENGKQCYVRINKNFTTKTKDPILHLKNSDFNKLKSDTSVCRIKIQYSISQ
jgi:LysM repeat protein